MSTTNPCLSESNDIAPDLNSSTAASEVTLAVSYRATELLIPHAKNSRKHSKEQVRKIKDSILEFGFVNPVLIDGDGTIIAGHGRVQAARLLKMEQVPTICLRDLTDDQIRAYMLADNEIAAKSSWDKELLKVELIHLESLPQFDVSLTGFTVPEIDLIVCGKFSKADQADVLPPMQETAVSQRGDLWLLGEHRVLCGDARAASSFTVLMGEQRASMVFTDPPFNVVIDGNAAGHGKTHYREFEMASGEMTKEEFTDFLTTCMGHAARVSANGSIHFVATDWRHLPEFLGAGERVYSDLLNLCVWNNGSGGLGSFYKSQHELFLVFKAGKGRHRNNIQLGKFGRNRSNVWDYPGASTTSRVRGEENLLSHHPTVKPIALVAEAILDCSAKGDLILDPFLGSGTTLLAAERTRRVCRGIEIDPLYVDLIIRRWQRLTGEHALHNETGVRFDERQEASHG